MLTATSTGRKPKLTVDGFSLYQMQINPERWKYLQTSRNQEHNPGNISEDVLFKGDGGRYRIRTYDFHRVKVALYR